ncbi:hypothetical protein, conserved [Eimeria necatrix]|uniref:Cytadherence high molecular weight protein 2, related n=1 Tax=Eimeria necatrix TaxID=51315 RepID=U6MIZ4_9EIME|nr:hypothetical protein, conserved [Eimeria necatrix]CDJ63023.1 hypothetical protein, conserved [Eimeria necatrix]
MEALFSPAECVGRCRFCEQPPAVIFVPQTAAIRVAVEVLLASGGRDTSFVGLMQLQLHATNGDETLPQDFYETQCDRGLCLWSDLVLRSPPGKYHIKAAVAGQVALGVPSTNAEYSNATVRPAVSAPIVFKKKVRFPQMKGTNANEALGQAESESASLLWFVQTVPRAVRVGQPWDLEVAVDLKSLNLTQSVLHKERLRRERETLGRRSALAGWSSWTEGSNSSRSLRSWRDRHRFIPQHRKTEPRNPNGLQHKLQVFIAESWPEGTIVLSGKAEGVTNGQGLATISGLALWLQDQRSTSFRKPSWVKLRVVCTSCSRANKEFRTQLETPKIYLDTTSAVGVYSDAGKAASALLRWQSAKLLHGPLTKSAALILPGHPAQLCVQLLDRPFADVLIKAEHEPGLVLLGESSIRVSPYAWPVSACWKFKAMSFEDQSEVHENGHKVYFQLISTDVSYSNSARVRWKGMAASDGSVKVIVLPSRPTLGPVAFRDLLRNPDVSRVAMLDTQQSGSPKWIELRSGLLQERVRLPMVTKVARSSRKTQAHTVAEQWAENKERLFLRWQSSAVVVELLPPQTKVVLELRPSAPLRSMLQITGQCVDTDAGNILVATLSRTIGAEISGGQSASKNQNSYGEQKSQELKLLLDWSQLNPSSAGLLRHRVVCDFRVASHTEQQVQFLPRPSVDFGNNVRRAKSLLSSVAANPVQKGSSALSALQSSVGLANLVQEEASRARPSSRTYAPVGSGLCYSCPEDAVCTDPAKRPEQCPLGWQRKGEEQVCTPCPPGKMCNGWSGIAAREFTDVRCPLGTYTKAEYPGVCIPCPPGFQCPDPIEAPQPCPSGTSSLGGSRTCSAAPAGLIVELGKEHLPPRPCDDGLMPIEVDGKWWCGVGYDDTSFDFEQNSSPMRSSPVASTDVTRAQSFPNLCTANLMDHKSCFSSYLPPSTWCPAYASAAPKNGALLDVVTFSFPGKEVSQDGLRNMTLQRNIHVGRATSAKGNTTGLGTACQERIQMRMGQTVSSVQQDGHAPILAQTANNW